VAHTMNNGTAVSKIAVVELAQGIYVRTSIPIENHSALRAGFGGYTANPRWGAAKFLAWKTGRQWRTALAANKMTVRASDSMLVPVIQRDDTYEAMSGHPVLRIEFA
jgi:hypothetical protein